MFFFLVNAKLCARACSYRNGVLQSGTPGSDSCSLPSDPLYSPIKTQQATPSSGCDSRFLPRGVVYANYLIV